MAVLVGGLTLRDAMWVEKTSFRELPDPRTGLQCFRSGGDHDYCSCLDRLESARELAGLSKSELPPFDHPLIRYAMRHADLYPIINADTLRCLSPPRQPPSGSTPA